MEFNTYEEMMNYLINDSNRANAWWTVSYNSSIHSYVFKVNYFKVEMPLSPSLE